jgi:hypothetical protein
MAECAVVTVFFCQKRILTYSTYEFYRRVKINCTRNCSVPIATTFLYIQTGTARDSQEGSVSIPETLGYSCPIRHLSRLAYDSSQINKFIIWSLGLSRFIRRKGLIKHETEILHYVLALDFYSGGTWFEFLLRCSCAVTFRGFSWSLHVKTRTVPRKNTTTDFRNP